MSSPTAEHHLAHLGGATGVDMERRRRNLLRWRRHSRLIGLLRVALPAAAVVLAVGPIAWTLASAIASLHAARPAAGLSIRMINPKFYGRNDAGKPVSLSAASAVRDDQLTQRIFLDKPVMLDGDAADLTHVDADKGIYREDTHILGLDGNVHLLDSAGWDFHSQKAVINTVTRDVDGQSAIDGVGPAGRIASSSYAVRDGGVHVFFYGHVRAHIVQQGARPVAPVAATGRAAMRGPQ